ncbi:hypothetical protein G6F37_010029 [Rhizopus arrhizus]|nr:hypothetical protein G6F38_007790 [Rhizopus arrhizus]KAG1153798.1 hypothetical protein G6F37_010029 [Rhizopus arrhizus]
MSAQLSLVRQFDGKDAVYDTSHWRGLITYSPHAERFSDDTQSISSKLECTVVAIYRKQERTALVITMDDKEERPSHKEDNIRYREDPDDLCRRLGLRVGSEFHHNPSNRSLDNRREYSIHQCERTYSDLLCPKTPCQKVSQLPHQIVHRQYYSSQIQQQVGGTASKILQDLAVKIQEICNSYNLDMEYEHISGRENFQADWLSRQHHTTSKNIIYNAHMPKRIFQQLSRIWGPLTIDAFADRMNTKLPTFWSMRPDPEAAATDAFQQTWRKQGIYIKRQLFFLWNNHYISHMRIYTINLNQ